MPESLKDILTNISFSNGFVSNSFEEKKEDEEKLMSDKELFIVTNYSKEAIKNMSTEAKNKLKSQFVAISGVSMNGEYIADRKVMFSREALKKSVAYFNKTVGKVPYLHNIYIDHNLWSVTNMVGASVSREYDEENNRVLFKGYINKNSKVGNIIESLKSVSVGVNTTSYNCNVCGDGCYGDYYGSCDKRGILQYNNAEEYELSIVAIPAIAKAGFEVLQKLNNVSSEHFTPQNKERETFSKESVETKVEDKKTYEELVEENNLLRIEREVLKLNRQK